MKIYVIYLLDKEGSLAAPWAFHKTQKGAEKNLSRFKKEFGRYGHRFTIFDEEVEE